MKVSNQPPQPPIRNSETGGDRSVKADQTAFSVGAEKASAGILDEIRSRYGAEDLKDPERAEAIVRDSLSALLGQQGVAGSLPDQQRDKLVDFLQSDPIIRGRIDSLLRKVLS